MDVDVSEVEAAVHGATDSDSAAASGETVLQRDALRARRAAVEAGRMWEEATAALALLQGGGGRAAGGALTEDLQRMVDQGFITLAQGTDMMPVALLPTPQGGMDEAEHRDRIARLQSAHRRLENAARVAEAAAVAEREDDDGSLVVFAFTTGLEVDDDVDAQAASPAGQRVGVAQGWHELASLCAVVVSLSLCLFLRYLLLDVAVPLVWKWVWYSCWEMSYLGQFGQLIFGSVVAIVVVWVWVKYKPEVQIS